MRTINQRYLTMLLLALVMFSMGTSANAWEGWTRVDELTLYPGSHLEIKFTHLEPHGCSPGNAWFTLNMSDPTPSERTTYTLLLLALMSHLEIYVATQGCQDGYEKVGHVELDSRTIAQIMTTCESCADLEGIELVWSPYRRLQEEVAVRR